MRTEEGVDTITGGGWSQSGTLFTRQPVPIVTMQANFPRASMYTVQFSVVPPSAPGVFDATATIQWTVKGNIIMRQCAVANGVSISGTGEAVKVTVADNTGANPLIPIGSPYQVTISATPGSRPSTAITPTLHVFAAAQILGAANSLNIPIPQNAGVTGVMIVASSDTAGSQVLLEVAESNGVFTTLTYAVETGVDLPTFVPLTGNGTVLTVQNIDAANAASVQVFFSIDG